MSENGQVAALLLIQMLMPKVHPWVDHVAPDGIHHYQLIEANWDHSAEYRISEDSCAGHTDTTFILKDGKVQKGSYIRQEFERGPICLPEPKELRD